MPMWIVIIGWFTKLVMGLLVVLSAWSLRIILDRRRFFQSQSLDALESVRSWIRSGDTARILKWTQENSSVAAQALKTIFELAHPTPEQADRSMESFLAHARGQLEEGLLVLGSLGSNAPFIGLFGTVLGIIQAFGALSMSQAGNMNQVMAGIAESLVATAIGLAVAIPAVLAFNNYSKKVRWVLSECESLKDFYVAQILLRRS